MTAFFSKFAIKCYLFPFDLLCVLQSISQLLRSVAPPLLQAATWSASISASFQILFLFGFTINRRANNHPCGIKTMSII